MLGQITLDISQSAGHRLNRFGRQLIYKAARMGGVRQFAAFGGLKIPFDLPVVASL